jgi:hypothetical protein
MIAASSSVAIDFASMSSRSTSRFWSARTMRVRRATLSVASAT